MIKKLLASTSLMLIMLQVAPLLTPVAHAASFGDSCNAVDRGKTFFGIPVWYKYVEKGAIDAGGFCAPDFQFPDDIWPISLAVLDGLLRVAGIIAIFFIALAGIAYMTSQGNADKAIAARQRILNAVVGLIITIVAAGLVQFIGNRLQQ